MSKLTRLEWHDNVPVEYVSFIRNLLSFDSDKNITWLIKMVGGVTEVGKLHDWMQTPNGVPITVTLIRSDNRIIQIPWGIIQTIEQVKE